MSNPNIIFFEVNEIPFRVVDDYAQRKPDSALAGLLRGAKQFETICEDQVELDPWISWPTLYRGVIDQQHQIFHLGQALEDADRAYPPLWQILSRHGVDVGLMGSLHSSTVPDDAERYAFYVPDFFADSTYAHPKSLTPFQAFNLAMTRRSTRNVDSKVAAREALRFLANYPRQGMSLGSLSEIVSVLLNELRQPHLKARRRALQPLISLDIFLHLMKKSLPGFATLHTNHVAAAMHRYWAAAFPGDVADNPMPLEWRAKYQNEVEYAMDVLDTMLSRLLGFVQHNPNYKLLVASSLGQAAVRAKITKGYVSIANVAALMRQLGVPDNRWSQRFAMAPQVSVVVDEAFAEDFERKLSQISIGECPMRASRRELQPLSFDRTGSSFQLYFYFEGYEGDSLARIGTTLVPFDQLGLGFHPHQDEVACSARHTPNGVLVVYDPKRPAVDTQRAKVSTLDIAPALLDAYGITPPAYMKPADPLLLDTGKRGVRAAPQAWGGGVERTVERAPAVAV